MRMFTTALFILLLGTMMNCQDERNYNKTHNGSLAVPPLNDPQNDEAATGPSANETDTSIGNDIKGVDGISVENEPSGSPSISLDETTPITTWMGMVSSNDCDGDGIEDELEMMYGADPCDPSGKLVPDVLGSTFVDYDDLSKPNADDYFKDNTIWPSTVWTFVQATLSQWNLNDFVDLCVVPNVARFSMYQNVPNSGGTLSNHYSERNGQYEPSSNTYLKFNGNQTMEIGSQGFFETGEYAVYHNILLFNINPYPGCIWALTYSHESATTTYRSCQGGGSVPDGTAGHIWKVFLFGELQTLGPGVYLFDDAWTRTMGKIPCI